MKDARGYGSEKGNRGRPALTHAQRRARRNERNPNYVREWRQKNPILAKAQAKRGNDLWRQRYPFRLMLHSAKVRAKKLKLDFSLKEDDLKNIAPEFCPVYGIKLEYGKIGSRQDVSASLDRIDNTKGYVKGNIEIVSWRANRHKSDATAGELRALAKYATERGL